MLKDKVIIISGATGGLGRVLTREFVKAGAKVVLSARIGGKLKALAETLPREQALVFPADASSVEEVEDLFEFASEKFGHIDAVVMSTGSWAQVGIDDSVEDAAKQADAHYQSFFKTSFVTSFVAQQVFRAQGHGLIVNISSHAAFDYKLSSNLTYGPMKAASLHLMKALRHELRGTKVRVADIEPGTINTEEMAARLDTPEKQSKAVQPEAIADWIVEHFDDENIPEATHFASGSTL